MKPDSIQSSCICQIKAGKEPAVFIEKAIDQNELKVMFVIYCHFDDSHSDRVCGDISL